jgi:hypothetical protein
MGGLPRFFLWLDCCVMRCRDGRLVACGGVFTGSCACVWLWDRVCLCVCTASGCQVLAPEQYFLAGL